MTKHPCQSCGACCAFFKVSFHWTETLKESFGVPVNLTAQASAYTNSMKGTETSTPRCTAFKGVVGEKVSCKIYESRPSCCRDFKASFENGLVSEGCEKARTSKGLRLLTLNDWSSQLIPE